MGEFLRLKPSAFEAPAGTLLRASDYAEWVAAGDLLAAARREAERIEGEARLAYEAEKKRGFEEGVEEGRREMTLRMLDSAVRSVDMISSMEDAMVDVVNRSIRTIIGDLDKRDVLERLVKKSLQYVRDQKKVVIRLHPDDAEAIQARLDRITRDFPSMVRVDVVPDARLEPTMCILETELGIVDASLDKQLDAIESALRKEVGNRVGT